MAMSTQLAQGRAAAPTRPAAFSGSRLQGSRCIGRPVLLQSSVVRNDRASLITVRKAGASATLVPAQKQITLPDKEYHPSPLSQPVPQTYAIIEVGGHQMFVEPGKWYSCNRLKAEEGSTIKFGRVLAYKDGDKTVFGTPYLENVSVQAEVAQHYKGPKVIVYKMKPKKHYRRKNGHRQLLSKFMITQVDVTGPDSDPVKPTAADVDALLTLVTKEEDKAAVKKALTSGDTMTALRAVLNLL